jgi:hypothetical protein
VCLVVSVFFVIGHEFVISLASCGSQVLVVDRRGKFTFLFGVGAYVCSFVSLFHVFRFV